MEKGNLIIGQSGGPTAVINSSLYGAILEAKRYACIEKVYGMKNGIDGLINDNICDLTDYSLSELELLKQTPSAVLGSVRYKLDKNFISADYAKIKSTLEKHNIKYILYIGGNDSMDSVLKLYDYFEKFKIDCKILGLPKTIDNDLDMTDHAPGYGSAAKFIANCVSAIKEDTSVYEKGRVTIVEIMGRDAGWLTAASKLASLNGNGPDLIYLPEVPFSRAKFLNDIVEVYGKKRKALVCVSEGIKYKNGKYVASSGLSGNKDAFGHSQLGKASEVLAEMATRELSVSVRAIEINLLQRCFSNLASLTDISEAIESAEYGVVKIMEGESGSMVVLRRADSKDYRVEFSLVKIDDIANKVKEVPKEWIVNGNDVSDEFIDYALPLIRHEYKLQYKNGVIEYFKLKK